MIELPFGDEAASKITCSIYNHALMGEGIRISHYFPVYGDHPSDFLPVKLSTLEVFRPEDCPFYEDSPHLVGGTYSWDHEPYRTKPFLNWSCFPPKFIIKTQINQDLKSYLNAKIEDALLSRARYLAKAYTGIEMTKEAVSSKRDEMESLVDFMGNGRDEELPNFLREAIGRDKS